MLGNFIDWRIENRVDDIIWEYDFTEKKEVAAVYPSGYHQFDKIGRPVYIERVGKIDTEKLWKITSEERMIKNYIQSYEILMKLIFPALSEKAGKRIQLGLNVIDLTDAGIPGKQVINLLKLAAKIC
jgi:hypothetical protein